MDLVTYASSSTDLLSNVKDYPALTIPIKKSGGGESVVKLVSHHGLIATSYNVSIFYHLARTKPDILYSTDAEIYFTNGQSTKSNSLIEMFLSRPGKQPYKISDSFLKFMSERCPNILSAINSREDRLQFNPIYSLAVKGNRFELLSRLLKRDKSLATSNCKLLDGNHMTLLQYALDDRKLFYIMACIDPNLIIKQFLDVRINELLSTEISLDQQVERDILDRIKLCLDMGGSVPQLKDAYKRLPSELLSLNSSNLKKTSGQILEGKLGDVEHRKRMIKVFFKENNDYSLQHKITIDEEVINVLLDCSLEHCLLTKFDEDKNESILLFISSRTNEDVLIKSIKFQQIISQMISVIAYQAKTSGELIVASKQELCKLFLESLNSERFKVTEFLLSKYLENKEKFSYEDLLTKNFKSTNGDENISILEMLIMKDPNINSIEKLIDHKDYIYHIINAELKHKGRISDKVIRKALSINFISTDILVKIMDYQFKQCGRISDEVVKKVISLNDPITTQYMIEKDKKVKDIIDEKNQPIYEKISSLIEIIISEERDGNSHFNNIDPKLDAKNFFIPSEDNIYLKLGSKFDDKINKMINLSRSLIHKDTDGLDMIRKFARERLKKGKESSVCRKRDNEAIAKNNTNETRVNKRVALSGGVASSSQVEQMASSSQVGQVASSSQVLPGRLISTSSSFLQAMLDQTNNQR